MSSAACKPVRALIQLLLPLLRLRCCCTTHRGLGAEETGVFVPHQLRQKQSRHDPLGCEHLCEGTAVASSSPAASCHSTRALLVPSLTPQDASHASPIIRALSVRTMGCIRVEKITEYLTKPLQAALNDEVRRFASYLLDTREDDLCVFRRAAGPLC